MGRTIPLLASADRTTLVGRLVWSLDKKYVRCSGLVDAALCTWHPVSSQQAEGRAIRGPGLSTEMTRFVDFGPASLTIFIKVKNSG